MDVKYPDVNAQLSGQDGNAFMIVGTVRRALVRAGVPAAEVKAYADEAMSGDYDNVLVTSMRWVNVQ